MTDTLAVRPAIEISEEIGAILAQALDNWKPVVVAYVDAANIAQLSFRGSVQRLNDKQLGLWARGVAPSGPSAETGMVKALDTNPMVSLLYADWTPGAWVYLSFIGRGKVVTDQATRDTIFANQPKVERDKDKARKGAAIVIDVDHMIGAMDGKALQMGAANLWKDVATSDS